MCLVYSKYFDLWIDYKWSYLTLLVKETQQMVATDLTKHNFTSSSLAAVVVRGLHQRWSQWGVNPPLFWGLARCRPLSCQDWTFSRRRSTPDTNRVSKRAVYLCQNVCSLKFQRRILTVPRLSPLSPHLLTERFKKKGQYFGRGLSGNIYKKKKRISYEYVSDCERWERWSCWNLQIQKHCKW